MPINKLPKTAKFQNTYMYDPSNSIQVNYHRVFSMLYKLKNKTKIRPIS